MTHTENVPLEDDVLKLSAILDEHRDTVLQIPDVTGCGIGLSVKGKPDRIVIQVYTASKSHVDAIQNKVNEIFKEHPVEAVYMPIPNAGLAA